MDSVVLGHTGGIDALEITTSPLPIIGQGDALVRVKASAVCGRDLIDRRGGLPGIRLPIILGHELAGEVVGTDGAACGLVAGDRIVNLHRASCGHCRACERGEPTWCEGGTPLIGQGIDGAYAEYVAVPSRALVRIPDELSFVDAAPLMCTAAVALRALRSVAKLEVDETVLITGASGGVGVAAIQIARKMGGRVTAVTRSPGKANLLFDLGAHEVIVGEGAQLRRSLCGRARPFDVALELTGAPTFATALRALRRGGRLVVIGNIPTEAVAVNPGWLILHETRIFGSFTCSRGDLEDVLAMAARKEIKSIIDRTLPLREVGQAHALLERGEVTGRIVLIP